MRKTSICIYMNIFPCKGKTVNFTLYENDGESLGYQRGENTTRTFSCTEKDGRINLAMDNRQVNGGYQFDVKRQLELRVFCSSKPKAVFYNNKKIRKGWNKSAGWFVVKETE